MPEVWRRLSTCSPPKQRLEQTRTETPQQMPAANAVGPVGMSGASEGEHAEHLLAVSCEAEALGGDGEAPRLDGALHGFHDGCVGNGTPSVGGRGGRDEREFREVHVFVAGIGEEGGCGHWISPFGWKWKAPWG